MAFRFDIQYYGAGALAFDVQTYAGGQHTVQDVFVDIYVVPNAGQTYTPAPAATAQNGTSAIVITANSAQSYAPPATTDTTQNGATNLTVVANSTQDYNPAPGNATTHNGAAALAVASNAAQAYAAFAVTVTSSSVAFALNGVAAKKRRRTVIDERDSAVLRLSFTNQDGIAVAPASVTYRLDCMTTFTAVRAVTVLAPAAVIDVALTSNDNALIDQNHVRELRRVTIAAVFANGVTENAQFDYLVNNFSGIT